MRIAVISDVHGNCLALDAVLAELEQQSIDRIVCLGDAIQGGPQPAEVVERLRALACPVVMGNADSFLLTGDEDGEPATPERLAKLQAVRQWSLTQLSDRDRKFIGGFQPTVMVDGPAGRRLLCFHGSPGSFNDIVLPSTPEDQFQRLLGGHGSELLAGGHTHLQQIRRIGESFFFNPGSVGFAYSPTQAEESFKADPWAEYAILSLDGGSVGIDFRRTPFDATSLIRIYRDSGRPYADEAAGQYETAR